MHSEHADEPANENFPAGQKPAVRTPLTGSEVMGLPELSDLEPHFRSDPPVVVVKVPAGHGLQAEAPASEKKPAAHGAVQALVATPTRP